MASEVLKLSDLASILRDDHVEKCTWWKDVGIQLGVDKHILDRIGQDNNNRTQHCKIEMIDWWLKNGDNPTLQKLHDAIARANSWHDSPGEEGKLASEAVDRIEKFMGDWDDDNLKIKYEYDRLERNLKSQEEWLPEMRSVDDENTEWSQSEQGQRQDTIMRVLGLETKFSESTFVVDFLRERGVTNVSMFSDKEIEAMLQRALADSQVERESQLTPIFLDVRAHRKDINDLNSRIESLRDALIERVVAYQKIKRFLEHTGASQDEINKVDHWIKVTDDAIERSEHVKKDCNKVYQSVQLNFESRKRDLSDLIQCMLETVQSMERLHSEYVNAMNAVFEGARAGARYGHRVFPVVGALIGAGVGAGLGWYNSQQKRDLIEDEIRKYNATMQRAKSDYKRISALLEE